MFDSFLSASILGRHQGSCVEAQSPQVWIGTRTSSARRFHHRIQGLDWRANVAASTRFSIRRTQLSQL